jgi:hypothetical protein
MADSTTQKRCTKCSQWKATSEFYHDKCRADGLRDWCKACALVANAKYYAEHSKEINAHQTKYRAEYPEKVRAHQAKWYTGHPEKARVGARKQNLASKYNITIEEYDIILAKHNGVCAICGNPPNGRRLAVDHNHTTGEVRGLLCYKCNTGLGCFNDSLGILAKAIEYLAVK